MDDFRFEQLDIWKEAMELSIKLFDIADLADEKNCLNLLNNSALLE